MYKIAIAGASTLLGRELKEALSESPLAASSFVLLDDDQAKGQLEQVGDEVTFIQAISPDAFDRIDFTFFAGSEELTRKHWRQALRAGSTVLDLTGALDQEMGVLVRAPWLVSAQRSSEADAADLFTPAVVRPTPPRWRWGSCLNACNWLRRCVSPLPLACARQRVRPRRNGRVAPADRKPAQLPEHAARYL